MTNGLSPKLTLPSIAMLIAGIAAVAAGLIADDKTLLSAGIGALGAAGIHLPIAYHANPGVVTHPLDEPGNDQLIATAAGTAPSAIAAPPPPPPSG